MITDDQLKTVYLQDDRADLATHQPMSVGASLLLILAVSVVLWLGIYLAARVLLG